MFSIQSLQRFCTARHFKIVKLDGDQGADVID
jgi:hypothetical protein